MGVGARGVAIAVTVGMSVPAAAMAQPAVATTTTTTTTRTPVVLACRVIPSEPLGSPPTAPINAPDGSVWYGEWHGSRIVRVDSAGGRTVHRALTRRGGFVWSVWWGLDSTAWYVKELRTIGRIGREGVAAAEFPLPRMRGRRSPIVIGNPAGTIVAVDVVDGIVHRLQGDGTWIEQLRFDQPAAAPMSAGFALAPDGAVWGTSWVHNRVTRIDGATGALRHYPLPSRAAMPGAIAIGPDGVVWVALGGAHAMARIGGDSLRVIPLGVRPGHVVAGFDGTAWYLDRERIVRIGRDDLLDDAFCRFPAATLVARPDGGAWAIKAAEIGFVTVTPR